MSSLISRKRSGTIFWVLSQNSGITAQSVPFLPFSSLSEPQPGDQQPSRSFDFTNPVQNHTVPESAFLTTSLETSKTPSGCHCYHTLSSCFSGSGSKHGVLSSGHSVSRINISGSEHGGRLPFSLFRRFSTATAIEPSTSDGLTVSGIIAHDWTILDESENDWKSHAAAIAQSIHVIKKRLQWKKMMVRLDVLSAELNKPDLWNDPVHAGKVSREHGSLMGKMKGVKAFEHELLEHIDMIKLAREENDPELESVGPHIFFS